MTPGVLDRWGEPLDPIEDDDPTPDSTTRTRDELHRDRIAQLRAILRAARERRQAQR
jgi:hypothetical protein